MVKKKDPRLISQPTAAKKKYFYLNGKLHKKLQLNKGTDILHAWCYSEQAVKQYPYTAAKSKMERAWDTVEVARMMGRSTKSLYNYVRIYELMEVPEKVSKNSTRSNFKWSKNHVLKLHSVLLQHHQGRPRLDGLITPRRGLPTRFELRKMLDSGEVYYVMDKDGNYLPTWKAPEWN